MWKLIYHHEKEITEGEITMDTLPIKDMANTYIEHSMVINNFCDNHRESVKKLFMPCVW